MGAHKAAGQTQPKSISKVTSKAWWYSSKQNYKLESWLLKVSGKSTVQKNGIYFSVELGNTQPIPLLARSTCHWHVWNPLEFPRSKQWHRTHVGSWHRTSPDTQPKRCVVPVLAQKCCHSGQATCQNLHSSISGDSSTSTAAWKEGAGKEHAKQTKLRPWVMQTEKPECFSAYGPHLGGGVCKFPLLKIQMEFEVSCPVTLLGVPQRILLQRAGARFISCC